MSDAVEMVVVNGIRYRPEDAPKRDAEEKAAEPKNKSRKPANKAADASEK